MATKPALDQRDADSISSALPAGSNDRELSLLIESNLRESEQIARFFEQMATLRRETAEKEAHLVARISDLETRCASLRSERDELAQQLAFARDYPAQPQADTLASREHSLEMARLQKRHDRQLERQRGQQDLADAATARTLAALERALIDERAAVKRISAALDQHRREAKAEVAQYRETLSARDDALVAHDEALRQAHLEQEALNQEAREWQSRLNAEWQTETARFEADLAHLKQWLAQGETLLLLVNDTRCRAIEGTKNDLLDHDVRQWVADLTRLDLPRPVVTEMEHGLCLDSEALLALDDQAFVRQAFRALLGRDADSAGEAHYLDRLREGISKTHILDQICQSPEGRAKPPMLPGLDSALRARRRARIPMIGWFLSLIGLAERDRPHDREIRRLHNQITVLRTRLASNPAD